MSHLLNNKLLVLSFFLVFCVNNVLYGQYQFRHLATADGLSQGSVISIAQDLNGLMWFGTRDGLNRYDGNQFTVYRNDPDDSTTLSNNDILEVLVDRSGDLWIGTYNGLNHYDYDQDRFTRYLKDEKDPNSLVHNSVWALCQSSNGTLYVGTAGGLCQLRNGRLERVYLTQDKTDVHVYELYQSTRGELYVGTSSGLFKTNPTGGFVPVTLVPGKEMHVQSIALSPDSMLWVGTRQGLFVLDKNLNVHRRFRSIPGADHSLSHDDVRSLSFDQKGNLWVGTYKGLNQYDGEKGFVRLLSDPADDGSLSKNTIKSTYVDRKGSLWVGVYYGGVNLLDETNSNFLNFSQQPAGRGLSYPVVSSMVELPSGKIVIGTEGGGINMLDMERQEIQHITTDNAQLSDDNIKSLFLQGNTLWVGTLSRGLDVYNMQSNEWVQHYDVQSGLSNNSVYSISHEENRVWLGTFGGGVQVLGLADQTFKTYLHDEQDPKSISDDHVRAVHVATDGGLWVGTQYGLNYLSPESRAEETTAFVRFFYNPEKRTGEDILVIHESSDGRIWVGTYESGLSLYDSQIQDFKAIDLFDGADGSSKVVHGILEDDEANLWISTNQGIVKYNPDTGESLTFDESDGLVSNEFNNNACLKTTNGRLFFGGPQGVSSFFPRKIQPNTYTPRTILTDFKVYNESVEVGGHILSQVISETSELVLDHDEAIFSIDFAIPNFINPDKNIYAYRLSGLEENWNISHTNTATYTIQRPGMYTFEVRGANNDGLWSDEVTTLAIRVKPAPWRTWWAFVIYFLVVVVSLLALGRIIASRSKLRHQLELEHLEHERQQSLHQMKLRFFTNISHEFRTPLTLILGPLAQILADYQGPNKVYKQLQVMEKNAQRLLRLINQLLDFRKFENQHEKLQAAEGNIVKFVEEIFLSFKQHAKIHNITYKLSKSDESIMAWYDRDKLERVFYNLLSNAFKYTDEGGRITVEIELQTSHVQIVVKDTGVGMAPEHLERIFDRFYEIEHQQPISKMQQAGTGIGLAIVKAVVEMHQGQIRAESEKGTGSTFSVSLPLGRAHLSEDQVLTDFRNSEDALVYQKINEDELELLREDKAQDLIHVNQDTSLPLILVVEDNASVRQLIVEVFAGEYRIEQAADGMEGFKKAINLVPDLIISDVMMPKMDGIEFCFQVKSNLKTSHIPFVLLTARTSLIFKFEGLESGADEYINKPFHVKEVQLKVRNLLRAFDRIRKKFAEDTVVKPADITVSSMDEKLLKRALDIIEEHIGNEFFNIQLFSSELGVSRTMLFTKIKAWTNLTPNEFIQSMRMKRAAQLLEQNKLSVSEVSYQVGYTNPKYFSKCFQKHHGETPSAYAEKFTVRTDEIDQ
ncbi:hybrid sensor histidine kinase/response regulator transcription factor [Marinoscillum furvescens]|uniref:histidine kinase n=1 Tax=Marinoscillum furvescens DSM 4134 TaxID=1122208 RepID=A0A3D9KXM6_MARFU|nr:hybrid sensor histidine kinase/response regulator transcription factor [Marinoscillum furvescens]RED93826.1 two component regulator with propeller domain [Marinoscillum furvescens DSM 4134]